MQGIYFHIPYCLSKCRYCDFYSLGGSAAVPQEYVDALLRELARLRWQLPGAPDTLYFGGGTPSLLRPAQLAQLIDAAQPRAGAEITLEANPETLTPALLRGFFAAGANRLSLGVQTAMDESLRRMGRPHTAAQARQALLWAQEAGFTNLSGDVMLALPGYTQKELDATLELLDSGGCTHISCYLLKLEPGTPWGKAPPAHLPGDDEAADFYLACVQALARAGLRSMKFQILQSRAMRAATTFCIGTASTIWALARTPTAALAAGVFSARRARRSSFPGPRPISRTAPARGKIISCCS